MDNISSKICSVLFRVCHWAAHATKPFDSSEHWTEWLRLKCKVLFINSSPIQLLLLLWLWFKAIQNWLHESASVRWDRAIIKPKIWNSSNYRIQWMTESFAMQFCNEWNFVWKFTFEWNLIDDTTCIMSDIKFYLSFVCWNIYSLA